MSKNHAISWNSEEFEKLVELVKPHPCLYHVQDTSRKNILEREITWEQIAEKLHKPVEECKKRWKALRDGYMKTQRIGSERRITSGLFTKLDFLNEPPEEEPEMLIEKLDDDDEDPVEETEQEVIMDKQEYYEIMLVDNPEPAKAKVSKLIMPPIAKRIQKPVGRRKKNQLQPMSMQQLQPIKILPKPMLMNPSIIQYVEDKPKITIPPPAPKPQKSEVIDSLIEKVLKEHTNEIDVFFRSMAASVKKLQPNLIPKVKMEVCNVIAKYEMQSFDKNGSH